MKLTGKLSAALLFSTLITGSAPAQIPVVVQHVQDKLNDVQQQKKSASDAALKNKPAAATAAKPTAATAVKPATAVGQKAPANTPVAKAATKPAVTAASNKPAAPAATKPGATTAKVATSNSTPAKAAAPASKPVTATAKPATPPATTAAKSFAPAKADPFAKSAALKGAAPKNAAPKTDAVKTAAAPANTKPAQAMASAAKTPATPTAAAKPEDSASSESKEEAADKKKESGYITAGNRRDPFVSPIVQHLGGSGCSTGKRCLAIDQIALRGIVKSDGGMIAVVVNSLDKAYFLRENDPVFNGYVLKISGDSVVFKETVQDKLGHLSTREVVKKITTPAV